MSCTVYVDGVKTATVFDDSYGGCFQWDIINKAKYAKFDEYVKSLPKVKSDYADGVFLTKDQDWVVGDIVTEFQVKQDRIRKMRKQTLYILKSSPDDVWQINHPFSPEMKAHLVKKHGEDLVKILNEEVA